MNSKTSPFVKIDTLTRFTKIFEFQKELDKEYGSNKQIFFDSSSLISMVAGLNDMFRLHTFRSDTFHSTRTLLLAFVYQGWLGPIHLLPPHLQEFIEQRKKNIRLFPEGTDEENDLITAIWQKLDLDPLVIDTIKKDKGLLKEFYKYEHLKNRSVDYLKLIYLTQDANWSNRLTRILRTRRPILKISPFPDYEIHKILSNNQLFTRLKKELDVERRIKPKNNYIDAIALCLLQQLLDIQQSSSDTSLPIPLFFADDGAISKVVNRVSKEKIEGVYPFIYHGKCGPNLIVQEADFFLIDAIFQDGRNQKSFKKFDDFVNQFRQWAEDSGSVRSFENHKEHSLPLKRKNEDIVFLKFVKHWFDKKGLESIKNAIETYYESEKDIKVAEIGKDLEEAKEHFEKEIHQVNHQVNQMQKIFDILSESYDSFQNLKADFNKKFPNRNNINFNAFNEFATRFSFSSNCCRRVTELIRNLHVHSEEQENDDSFEDVKADIITDLLTATNLDDLAPSKKIEGKNVIDTSKEKINLYAALGLLWTLEKYTLLENICEIIRKEYSEIYYNDYYPDYQVAILHAAAILKNPLNHDLKKAVTILKCVEDKFAKKNYQVWISLSYLYYLLWKEANDKHAIPELQFESFDPKKQKFIKINEYTKNARNYAALAVDYLKNREDEESDDDAERVALRNRRYYYALNNLVYFDIMNGRLEDFDDIKLKNNISMLREAEEKKLGQARYKDTLARYYQRRAAVLMVNSNFDPKDKIRYQEDLERGLKLMEAAIHEAEESGLDDLSAFKNLKQELEEMSVRNNNEGINYLQAFKIERDSKK